jgi:hypothetical protein
MITPRRARKTPLLGLHRGICFDAYRALPGVNWSSLKVLRESAAAYKQHQLAPPEPSRGMRLGVAVHTLALEPATFDQGHAVWDGTRRGKDWLEFEALHADRTILTAGEFQQARDMAAAVRAHPLAGRLIAAAEQTDSIESTLIWRDPMTRLLCKARPDLFVKSERLIADLKTSSVIDARLFGATAARLGYIEQLCHYAAGLTRATRRRVDRLLIIAVHDDPPHEIGVFEVPADARALAEFEVARLLDQLKAHLAANSWPGRHPTDTAVPLALPGWYFMGSDDITEEMSYGN